ncbi:Ppx/GppA phosphatase family protein [Fructobacillus ficulneus]|uniref:Exopolyphosphatase n=1 Tax=Fructobacillus ficulneus TaxID=157463 RepID=A0A0K8MFE0_9LACO|nr:exopolyphosphatase [Fructobacillus ficulneus]GAO99251.1 exopolyphosphatase [Fructobacillus ficulneus]
MDAKKIAIIDLGSNSTRLVIEELHSDRKYQEVYRVKEDTRLSQNMGTDLLLRPEPIRRTIAVLKDYQKIISGFTVDQTFAITTAAVRTAKNQKEFLDQVLDETGIQFRVLTGQEEAHYDFLGVQAALPDVKAGIILDTGGASVEVIPFENGKSAAEVSLPFGAVNLSEKYSLASDIDLQDVQKASLAIQADFSKLDFVQNFQNHPIILLGGANRSLAKMAEKQALVQKSKKLHGFMMPANQVTEIFNKISGMSRSDREHLAGLEKSRADIIVSGLLPVLNLIKVFTAPQVIFSESGVREGLIESFFETEEKKEL